MLRNQPLMFLPFLAIFSTKLAATPLLILLKHQQAIVLAWEVCFLNYNVFLFYVGWWFWKENYFDSVSVTDKLPSKPQAIVESKESFK